METVTLRGGLRVSWEVIERLIAIEFRGGEFVRQSDGSFRVEPVSVLTTADIAFLRKHAKEAREVVAYSRTVDDSHLKENTP